jgi:hypothetical protein
MRHVLHAISRLSIGKKIVVFVLVALIILTWLAVCAVLGSYLVS